MTQDGFPEQLSPEILAAISAAVRAAFLEHNHVCRLDLQEDMKTDVHGAIHDIRQLGSGSLSAGLHDMNENHRWIKGIRAKSEKASWAFTIAVITVIAVGSASVFLSGFISRLKGQ